MASTTTIRHQVTRAPWIALAAAVAFALLVGATVGESFWVVPAAVLAIPLLLRWPMEVALGAFAFLVPFEGGLLTEGDNGRTLVWFVGAAAASTVLITGLVQGRLRKPPRAALWWTLFVAWSSLSVLWAIDPQIVLLRIPTAVSILALYLATLSVQMNEREFKRIVVLAVLGGCLAGAYASYEFYNGLMYYKTSMRESLILDSAEVNPNVFATRLLLPMALAVAGYFRARSRLRKTILLAGCAVLILAMLLTMSRAVFLALFVMLAVFVLRLGMTRRILPLIAALALLIAAMPSQFFERVSEAAASGGAGRVDIWLVGLQLLKHYGIFGAGMGNFPVAYSRYAGYAPQFRGYHRDAHNIYLAVAVEFGIVGLFLLLNAVRVQLWAAKDIRDKDGRPKIWVVACEAAGWAIMCVAFFDNLVWQKMFWLTWIMFALASQLPETGTRQGIPVVAGEGSVWPGIRSGPLAYRAPSRG